MATVYFGTNRRQTGPLTFGAAMGPLDRTGLICAEATVDGLTLANADSGRITAITHETATGFAPTTRQAILGSDKDLLVFIHGFANAFEAAGTVTEFVPLDRIPLLARGDVELFA